ncbi:hypothetical protein Mapa_018210 [Marchantia paleacea]|nr:hypothetical protein Mapa_018210 [Marchantia paleacea]
MRFIIILLLLIASFFVNKADFKSSMFIFHSLHISLKLISSIPIPTLLCQSHKPLSITRKQQIKML